MTFNKHSILIDLRIRLTLLGFSLRVKEIIYLKNEKKILRDLTSWINSMIAQVSSDELARDVPGAEALLERNHVRNKDIF